MEYARKIIAKELHAHPEQIIFTSGGTEANNLVLKQCMKGKKIALSSIEHSSLLVPASEVPHQLLPVDGEGVLKEVSLDPNVDLVSVMHVNNEVGSVQNMDALCDLAHDHDALFHTDAVQSFCKIKMDVRKIPVDFLTMSAHKIHGPKGIGALYVAEPKALYPLLKGGDQEFSLRAGTPNVANIVGFGQAVASYIPPSRAVFKAFHEMYYLGIMNGSRNRLPSILNLAFPGVSATDLLNHLSYQNVFVSAGSACTSQNKKPSHVLQAMNLPKEFLQSSLRFSIGSLTTKEEIQYASRAVEQIVLSLRSVQKHGLLKRFRRQRAV